MPAVDLAVLRPDDDLLLAVTVEVGDRHPADDRGVGDRHEALHERGRGERQVGRRIRVHREAGQLRAVGAQRVHLAVAVTEDDLELVVVVEVDEGHREPL